MTMLPPDPVYIFKGEMDPVSCVTFKIANEVDGLIFVGTQSGNVHIWSLKTKREVGKLKAGEDTCLSVVASEEGGVVTQTKSGEVTFWKEENESWVIDKKIQTDFFGFCRADVFRDVVYSALKGCRLMSFGPGDRTATLDLGDGPHLGELMAFRVAEANGRSFVLAAYEGQKLVAWDQGRKAGELALDACPMALDLDSGGRRGLLGDTTDQLLVFSLDEDLRPRAERKVKLKNAGVAAVRIRGDRRVAAVGCWDGRLRLHSWKTLVLLAVLDTHSGTVQDVAFGVGGGGKFLLAAGAKDGRVSLWDLYNR